MERMPDFDAHSNQGAGWPSFDHYVQGMWSGKFQRYDWGPLMNQDKYGQTTPPEYDLSKINIKSVIFNGDLDTASQPKDVNGWLLKED